MRTDRRSFDLKGVLFRCLHKSTQDKVR